VFTSTFNTLLDNNVVNIIQSSFTSTSTPVQGRLNF
jgi:hypothetical protein